MYQISGTLLGQKFYEAERVPDVTFEIPIFVCMIRYLQNYDILMYPSQKSSMYMYHINVRRKTVVFVFQGNFMLWSSFLALVL